MNGRRAFPRGLQWACVSTAGLLLLPATPAESAPPRPNIVVILVDDMGFSDIGCYGGEITTPNIGQRGSHPGRQSRDRR